MNIQIPKDTNPAERSAWLLIKSWERRGILVQQAHLIERTN